MGACVSRCLQPWLEPQDPKTLRSFSAQYRERRLSIEVDAPYVDDSDDDSAPLAQLNWVTTPDQEAIDSRQKRNERTHESESHKGRHLEDEEDCRSEEFEDAYYEATKAAARATELAKERAKTEQTLRDFGNSSQQAVLSMTGGASLGDWLTEPDGAGNAGGTEGSAQQELEDFELFLESVKKRSLSQSSQRSLDSARNGLELLGAKSSSGRTDNFTRFEDSVMPPATAAQ